MLQCTQRLKKQGESMNKYIIIGIIIVIALLVFVFNRAETKDVFDKWCKHELV